MIACRWRPRCQTRRTRARARWTPPTRASRPAPQPRPSTALVPSGKLGKFPFVFQNVLDIRRARTTQAWGGGSFIMTLIDIGRWQYEAGDRGVNRRKRMTLNTIQTNPSCSTGQCCSVAKWVLWHYWYQPQIFEKQIKDNLIYLGCRIQSLQKNGNHIKRASDMDAKWNCNCVIVNPVYILFLDWNEPITVIL